MQLINNILFIVEHILIFWNTCIFLSVQPGTCFQIDATLFAGTRLTTTDFDATLQVKQTASYLKIDKICVFTQQILPS